MNIDNRTLTWVYMVMWTLLIIAAGTYIIMTGITLKTYECIDGTQVKNEADCVQCVTNEHCKIDFVCKKGQCVSKDCQADSDCENINNRCIYSQCRPG